MATQSPFSWAAQALPQIAARFQPPAWVVDETLNRLVLFLNHVLMSEPQACQRLARQKGQRIEIVWQSMKLQLQPTAAGWSVATSPKSASRAMCSSLPKSTG
jgi:ubiquinone biosynthesis protein UbiJ